MLVWFNGLMNRLQPFCHFSGLITFAEHTLEADSLVLRGGRILSEDGVG